MSLPDDVEAVLIAAEKPLTIGELRERLPNPGVATMPVVMALTALQRKGLARECRNASDQNAWARCSNGAEKAEKPSEPSAGASGDPLTQRILRLLGSAVAPMCTTDIAAALSAKGDLVSATLCNMRAQGRVERRGQGHGGLWAVVDESKQATARAERRAEAEARRANAPAPMPAPSEEPHAAVAEPADAAPIEERDDARRERLAELIAEIGDRISATTEQLALAKRAYNALVKECRQPKALEPQEATA